MSYIKNMQYLTFTSVVKNSLITCFSDGIKIKLNLNISPDNFYVYNVSKWLSACLLLVEIYFSNLFLCSESHGPYKIFTEFCQIYVYFAFWKLCSL
jgi:hypothetical protein